MPEDQPLLRAFLADHDAKCDTCGHALRGVDAARCPGCQRELRLCVRAKNHTLAPWLFALVSLALGAGFDGVALVLLLTLSLVSAAHGQFPPEAAIILPAFALACATLLAVILWIARQRRAWGRLPTRTQWIRAAAVFAAVFAVHAAVPLWFWIR